MELLQYYFFKRVKSCIQTSAPASILVFVSAVEDDVRRCVWFSTIRKKRECASNFVIVLFAGGARVFHIRDSLLVFLKLNQAAVESYQIAVKAPQLLHESADVKSVATARPLRDEVFEARHWVCFGLVE